MNVIRYLPCYQNLSKQGGIIDNYNICTLNNIRQILRTARRTPQAIFRIPHAAYRTPQAAYPFKR